MRLNRQTSLQRRLPLYVSLLILGVVVALSLLGYREQRALLLDSADVHLDAAATQLTSALGQSARGALRSAQPLAASAAVAELLSNESAAARARARDTLTSLLASNAQVAAFGIYNVSGEQLLLIARTEADSQRLAEQPPMPVGSLVPGVGPFLGGDTLVHYTVVSPIPDTSAVQGWLVTYAPGRNPDAARLLEGMIGQDAKFLVGSPSNNHWTDLERAVPSPVVLSGGGNVADYRGAEGERLRGVRRAVPNAAWEVWVAQPYATVMAPARVLASRMLGLGALVVLAGLAVAIVMSRRLTRPITELKRAAEKLSNGEYAERVPVRGTDEVAEMAQSFNRMADRVEESTRELEARVEARTAELRMALTDLENAQDQLVRRERLAMLGQLASGVGHELRNPLGVMLNATYYLDYVLKDSSHDVHEYLGILQGQIGLAEKIVSDLLDFARIKPPQREEVVLSKLLDEQITRLGPLENVELVREYDDAAPTSFIDRVQVGQVVFNLLTNAVQAMAEGGRLTVRTSFADESALIEVGDTAGGVAPENMERIFEPLFTTKARGIGLGLAVSRSLAQANEGDLQVRNESEGAVFTLTLPRVPALVA